MIKFQIKIENFIIITKYWFCLSISCDLQNSRNFTEYRLCTFRFISRCETHDL